MAKVVNAVPPSARGPRGQLYPWEEWFDGQVWELTQGEDFKPSMKVFRDIVYQTASRHGVRVSVNVRGNKLYIQARARS